MMTISLEAVREAVADERSRASEIARLCHARGTPLLAEQHILSGASLAEVQRALARHTPAAADPSRVFDPAWITQQLAVRQ